MVLCESISLGDSETHYRCACEGVSSDDFLMWLAPSMVCYADRIEGEMEKAAGASIRIPTFF